MALVLVLVVLAVVGLVTWAIVTLIPMPPPFQRFIVAVAIIASIIWLLSLAGLLPSLATVKFPHR